MDGLHEKHEGLSSFSVDELSASFWIAYPEASHALYDGIFVDLAAINISEQVAEDLFHQLRLKNTARSLADASFELSQGRGSLDEIKRLTEALNASETKSESYECVSTNLEEIATSAISEPGLRWRLNCLNVSLGSLRKGDFGFIFARPESGKSTFLASEISYMIDQTTRPIVWFNNEEQGNKVMMRFGQAYFGIDLSTMLGNIQKYKALFSEKVKDKFILIDNAGLDKKTVEYIVNDVKPSLIAFDQLDKIQGFKADRDDLIQGAVYQWARELAKTHCPVIGVCQADGTAEGQKWLTMANVANAKTSKQAEADWIMGIGKTYDEESEYIRYLNISKNKLMGDKDSMQNLRHGRFEVLLQPEIARYKDIVEYV